MSTEETNNLSQHLDHARYGDQQLHPDEQNMYLGSFKERVYFVMTVTELNQDGYLPEWQIALTKYTDATLLLNGNLPIDTLTPFLNLAKKENFPVQLKNDSRYRITPTSVAIALVNLIEVVANPAQPISNLRQPIESATPTQPKLSWWQKLFKGN
ncbi:DUF1694 domain-containing protein [Periweissella fabalis]|uniref:YueI family protein n=1 Tax=Periweissella fabalis TaxID=1070421 RepID=A0A7X6N4G3_9LACO|nr:DUF1694 domain-containing protein [Periweissella fabalis]MCM0598210.1 DUF1694 domain-containing protein [Periweissella fabalis]NKZ24855.1 YueI family protein [Periweissella fabalis]